eukprot:11204293-Lingulodinium_polyedra.AAC.1
MGLIGKSTGTQSSARGWQQIRHRTMTGPTPQFAFQYRARLRSRIPRGFGESTRAASLPSVVCHRLLRNQPEPQS